MGTIRVIATAQGYDGTSIQEVGNEFDMPDDVFDRRQKLNADGEPIANQFYEPPSWFEPVDKSLKAKVEADRKAARKSGRVPAINPAQQEASAQAESRRLADEQAAAIKKAREDEEKERQEREQADKEAARKKGHHKE